MTGLLIHWYINWPPLMVEALLRPGVTYTYDFYAEEWFDISVIILIKPIGQ